MSGTSKPRILVIEDEPTIADAVAARLRSADFAVEIAADGPAGVAACAAGAPDLVVLDLMLPGLDGMEVTREIRRHAETPILMLTARAEEIDRILGLELGADDYLPKPFHPRELVARVKAILRRTDPAARTGRPLVTGDLRIDPRRREVTLAGVALTLRPREFDLLAALARDPGVVWSRDDLLAHVWGTDYPGETRTVDVHVSALRARLGPEGPAIEAVKGVGYRLVPRSAEPRA